MVRSRWRDWWVAFRNRWLGDARFHRWAVDFPLTRPIALRRARELFDIVSGFVYSQALAACVEVRLLEHLADGARTTADLAELTDLPLASAERLLIACAALNLVERAGPSRWALGPQGAALRGNAGLSQMIAHHARLYADLGDSVEVLRRQGIQGRLAEFWPYATSTSPESVGATEVGGYSSLMTATQASVLADVLDAYPIERHRRLLDVGGGEGAFIAAAARRSPRLDLMLFDLPAVTSAARRALERAGVLNRTSLYSGDFLTEALPTGADLITLIRILHDHDDVGVGHLLRSARAALADDGTLLVAEPMSDAPRRDRVSDVYFAFYLLAMGRGRTRTPREIRTLMRDAGFRRTRMLRTRTPFLLRAIIAHP